MLRSAELSRDGRYRYELTRRWGRGVTVPWLMLNPSTADWTNDDATIRKCRGFSERHGAGSIRVYNLYALRARDPKALFRALRAGEDVQGDNDLWLVRIAHYLRTVGGPMVVAWGANPVPQSRIDEVVAIFDGIPLMCFGRVGSGAPRHPLMTPYETKLERWVGASSG